MGVPVHDDRNMFEHLTLENLQCGLSWLLVMRKRDIFRQCFDNFDYDKVGPHGDYDVERILNTDGMIRFPRKTRAVISNAQCCARKYGTSSEACVTISGALPAAKRFSTKAMPRGRFP